MPSSPSRQDPLRAPTTTDAPHARPQHHDIFLEPRYTVELPPLHEAEGDEEPTMESLFERPQGRRRTPIQRRG
ncbi:hypothetical protein [Streptomyces corynorhini]|uniref:Uncharacterized protein n=1 Tax=Streptomyces corynorhini TaxID=2282652 RepID=A0A370BF57_9ACTN|nr:hypothetical protein [Streptomyces corynorhini]RDG38336.1 hypothetical protein DVH02_09795 [Streptomyces corynorhini]